LHEQPIIGTPCEVPVPKKVNFIRALIGSWLLVIGYWLLVIGYWLLVIGYWLLVVDYWLLDIGYSW
jgi:hypothetical protein